MSLNKERLAEFLTPTPPCCQPSSWDDCLTVETSGSDSCVSRWFRPKNKNNKERLAETCLKFPVFDRRPEHPPRAMRVLCTCTHIYACIYIYIYIYICIHIYIYMYIYMCVCSPIYGYMYSPIHIYIYIYVYAYIYIYIYTCIYI